MILAVTMNPSVDISYRLDSLNINGVTRVENTIKTAGGKGLNVARVIHLLNESVMATGVLGGTLGEFIKAELNKSSIDNDFFQTKHESRNCIAILHDNGKQTEILEKGPLLSKKDQTDFLKHFEKLLPSVTVVTISGSLPRGFDIDLYQTMIDIAQSNGIPVLLDASGDSLKNSLLGNHKPYLIKPNQEEIQELLHATNPITDLHELKEKLKDKLFNGIQWIVVSMGADGAFVKHKEVFYRVTIPKIHVVNPVGSGDSTLSGLAVAIANHKNDDDCLKAAMTSGILNTLESKTGYIDYSKFDKYFSQVIVKPFQ